MPSERPVFLPRSPFRRPETFWLLLRWIALVSSCGQTRRSSAKWRCATLTKMILRTCLCLPCTAQTMMQVSIFAFRQSRSNTLTWSLHDTDLEGITPVGEPEYQDIYTTPDQIAEEMMTLSLVPRSKWQTLLNLDTIRVSVLRLGQLDWLLT